MGITQDQAGGAEEARSVAEDWARELAAAPWSSKASRVADILERRIAEGKHLPGSPVVETEVSQGLKVSRNTVREAFRLLTYQGLLQHTPGKGVSVHDPDSADVRDLYRLRRAVQPAVLRSLEGLEPNLVMVRAAVASAAASPDTEWRELGTANLHFHQAMTALSGSKRLVEVLNRALAELRLVFYAVPDLREFHLAYRSRNAALLELMEAHRFVAAADELTRYLHDAEADLLAAQARARQARRTEADAREAERLAAKAAAKAARRPAY